MIKIKTPYWTHEYWGNVILRAENGFIFVEAHATMPRESTDDLEIWAADTFDVFVETDVLSIQGVD
jgi:hypothetical protein